MKKILCAMIVASSAAAASAGTAPEMPDTVKVIENPRKVMVSRTGDSTLIEVERQDIYGKDSFFYNITVSDADDSESSIDFEVPFGIGNRKEGKSSDRRIRTSVFAMGNVCIGHRFNYGGKGAVKNSTEGAFRDLIGMRWSLGAYGPSFSIGLGFGYQRYGARDGFAYAKDGSRLILVPAGERCRVRHSDFYIYNFQVPLLFRIPIGRDVKLQAGAIGLFNTYALAKTEIEKGNAKQTITYKGLQQRLFTAELTASVGLWDTIGVYASWSPMTAFQAPYGPQLKGWSIGATVNF